LSIFTRPRTVAQSQETPKARNVSASASERKMVREAMASTISTVRNGEPSLGQRRQPLPGFSGSVAHLLTNSTLFLAPHESRQCTRWVDGQEIRSPSRTWLGGFLLSFPFVKIAELAL
jgi:hypothetical protein